MTKKKRADLKVCTTKKSKNVVQDFSPADTAHCFAAPFYKDKEGLREILDEGSNLPWPPETVS
jgi:hypothetical protein